MHQMPGQQQKGPNMIARALVAAAALMNVAPSYAAGPAVPVAGETRIRDMAEALEWVIDPQRGVYVRDRRGHWFYARVRACPRLNQGTPLRFNASPGGYLDRNSSIRAGGWRCWVTSVTQSDGPPPRHNR
jgi:hypothetical protein